MTEINLDNNKLTNVFIMLSERLSNIETNLESIRESIKFNEIRHYGEINTSIFDWKFELTRYDGSCNILTVKPAPYQITCVCMSIDNLIGIDLSSTDKYDSILESLKIDPVKVHEIANRYPKGYVACQDVGYGSHFDYVSYIIAQKIIDRIVSGNKTWQRVLLDDFDGERIWLWKNTPGTIEDFLDFYQKIMSALGLHTFVRVDLIDFPPDEAYFVYLMKKYHEESEIAQEYTIKELRNLQSIHKFSENKLAHYPLFQEAVKMLPEIRDFQW